jgi:hypothetical protein
MGGQASPWWSPGPVVLDDGDVLDGLVVGRVAEVVLVEVLDIQVDDIVVDAVPWDECSVR